MSTPTLSVAGPAIERIAPVMTQIDTVVMLMLENRSLDQMLGWLYRSGAPAFVYPPGSPPKFDGIPDGAQNSSGTSSYSPALGTGGFAQPCRVPAFDPYEPLSHVQYQLYANGNGAMPPGYFWANEPGMTGFAWDYFAHYERQPGEVMGAFSAAELPVMYGLAEHFAVSDRWFASVPTQTDPNRAFSVCGTANGAEDNGDINEKTFQGTNTIFNVLAEAGKSWGLFYQSENPLGTGEPLFSWKPFTSYYFPRMNQAPHGGVRPFKELLSAAAAGTLPDFSLIEPWWGGGAGDAVDNNAWVGIQGNDYHPPAWIGPAESDLNALYEALIASPQWPRMLFIITFDEHGGTYDHVPPPPAVPPDQHVGKTGFRYDRLGVRVPMLLVSPFIRPGTVFRAPADSRWQFDHTSTIATLLKWAGVDPASASLGARVAVAPTFEGVLAGTPRTEAPPHFAVPPGYAQQGGGTGHLNVFTSGAVNHVAALDVRHVREAIDSSDDAHDLEARLQDLTAAPENQVPALVPMREAVE